MSSMEQHALAILEHSELWNWPDTKRTQTSRERWQAEEFQVIAPKLLCLLIVESQQLGGDVLHYFWKQLETNDEKMKENIARLQQENFTSAQRSLEVLSQGLDHNIGFESVFEIAAEFFMHLGVPFISPGTSTESTDSDASSIGELINKETNQLLQEVQEKGAVEKQKQELLKALCFRRDGESCLLTGAQFAPFKEGHGVVHSELCHIVPNSVYSKQDTLKSISMFAGAATIADIMNNLNDIGNVMNMQHDAHFSYDQLRWGIQAKEEDGEVKYFFQLTQNPSSPKASIGDTRGPGYISLRTGDEIWFGKGPDAGGKLNKGPVASLCNLQLAIARAFSMSGAADIILRWKDEVDDTGCASHFIRSEDDCQLLDARLLFSRE